MFDHFGLFGVGHSLSIRLNPSHTLDRFVAGRPAFSLSLLMLEFRQIIYQYTHIARDRHTGDSSTQVQDDLQFLIEKLPVPGPSPIYRQQVSADEICLALISPGKEEHTSPFNSQVSHSSQLP